MGMGAFAARLHRASAELGRGGLGSSRLPEHVLLRWQHAQQLEPLDHILSPECHIERLRPLDTTTSSLKPSKFLKIFGSLIRGISMDEQKIYRASTTAPVNIAVIK